MKKLISSLLALIMVMGMFSGVVLFGSGAEFDINTYVFTQIPGIQDWDDTIMATYNELANTSGAKRVGTPASTTHIIYIGNSLMRTYRSGMA